MPNINIRSRYRSSGDIQQRHSDTYVGIKDRNTGEITPMYCMGTEGGYPDRPSLHLRDEHGDSRSVRLSDSLLVVDRPELGLANITSNSGRKHAIMFYGTAHRQYKRSLSWSHMDCEPIGDSDGISIGDRKRYQLLKQFFNDIYPTFSQALERITSDNRTNSIAFSRRFCIVKTSNGLVLYYETTPVGYISNDSETVLFTHYQHLAEQLEEDK